MSPSSSDEGDDSGLGQAAEPPPKPASKKASGRSREARSAARLSAVQALYQMDLANTDLNQVIHEFADLRATAEELDAVDEVVIATADRTFFAEILRGVVRLQKTIDPEVDGQLVRGWRLARVDSILRQTLRAALYELIDRRDVPGRVVINEYIEIAKAFFEGEEPRVVNGVLDRLAQKYRPDEFPTPYVDPRAGAPAAVAEDAGLAKGKTAPPKAGDAPPTAIDDDATAKPRDRSNTLSLPAKGAAAGQAAGETGLPAEVKPSDEIAPNARKPEPASADGKKK